MLGPGLALDPLRARLIVSVFFLLHFCQMSHLETIFIHPEVVVGSLGPTPVGNP